MALSFARKMKKVRGEDRHVFFSVVLRKIGKVGRWKRQEEGGRGRKRSEANSCLGLWAENAELYSHFVDLPRGQFPCQFIEYTLGMTYTRQSSSLSSSSAGYRDDG